MESLSARAAASPWVNAGDGLADAVALWEAAYGPARDALGDAAMTAARFAPVSPRAFQRHATATVVHRAVRVATSLPAALAAQAPFRDTRRWAAKAAVEAAVDQLALGGPSAAEVIRLIEGAGPLFPGELRDELARREIELPPFTAVTAADIARRAVGPVLLGDEDPVVSIPVSQLHRGVLPDGPRVLVRVRRPLVARDLRDDLALVGGLASAVAQIAPDAGAVGPSGFVQLVARQALEATDLCFEALDLVELGLVAEALGLDSVVVTRPRAGGVNARALLLEDLEGESLADPAVTVPDGVAAVQAVAGLTLEAALVHGVFWADPAPEHLLALPDGRLGIIGVSTLGRLSPELRLAGLQLLRSLVSGDHRGQIEAMRLAGALPEHADTTELEAALAASPALELTAIMMGGQDGLFGGINEVVRIMLAHRVRPPVEVALLLRTVFALGVLADRLAPGAGGLMVALLPLLPRMPEILAAAEAAVAESAGREDRPGG